MQNGHFISRGEYATRYDEENCRVQCVGCNVYKHGNYPVYASRLIKEKGKGIIDKLIAKSKERLGWGIKDYQNFIAEMKEKINKLNVR